MKKHFAIFFLIIIFFQSANLFAQDGTNDSSFDPGTGAAYTVDAIAIQNDGKIIIGGWFESYNGTAINRIARLNSDGSLDNTFNPGTGANATVSTVVIQSDGKIIIGGEFTSYNDVTVNYIARLNTDGSLDNTFNTGTGFSGSSGDQVTTLTIQSDGKIMVGGSFTSYNGTNINRIARLNTDGTLDNSFDPGTGPSGTVFTSLIQDDGKIIIGGGFTSYNGTAANYLARLNADGSLDNTFDSGSGGVDSFASALQSDGKIIIGGEFTSYNGTSSSKIARVNSDGSLDGTFNVGAGADQTIYAIAIQSDGKIIIGGGFTSYNGTAVGNLVRLNSDGSIDNTFNMGTGPNYSIYAIEFQSDSKIIIGGFFTDYNGVGRNRIARLNNGVSTGVSNYIQKEIFSVFPNPCKGIFNVKLENANAFALINQLGQTIRIVKLEAGMSEVIIDGLENGIYYLISISESQLRQKIVIDK